MKFFKILILLFLVTGCGPSVHYRPGPEGPPGPPGEQGPPGEPGEDLFDPPEGFSGAMECAEEALPDYEIKSFSINQNNGEVTIKLIPLGEGE